VAIWGFISVCIGFVKSYAGLLAARFFLGLAEGGLLGGMVIYLADFYPRHELMKRIGVFYCAAPLSGAFGGLLATGLAEIRVGNYNRWPWIFFVEGAFTTLFGIVTMFFLPNSPGEANFLTPLQRSHALTKMQQDSPQTGLSIKRQLRNGIFNWETILLSLAFFAIITPIYSFSLFLPTIVKSLGYTSVKAQLLTVPPNMGGFFAVLLLTWLSDKIKKRGVLMLIGEGVAIIGYIMQIASNRPLIRYGGTFLVAAGVFPCSPLVMGWLANNLAPQYVRATGTGFQIMVANLAAFIATFTYVESDA
jgi:MFS family permease